MIEITPDFIAPKELIDSDERNAFIQKSISDWLTSNSLPKENFLARQKTATDGAKSGSGTSVLEQVLNALDRRCRAASPRYRDRLRQRRPLPLPTVRHGGLPRARHVHAGVAASRLLPAPGLPARACGAHHLPRLRRQTDRRAVGQERFRLHPAVRGPGHDARHRHAGQGRSSACEGA